MPGSGISSSANELKVRNFTLVLSILNQTNDAENATKQAFSSPKGIFVLV